MTPADRTEERADRDRLAILLAENGIAVENVGSIGNAEQWLPDYALADRLLAEAEGRA